MPDENIREAIDGEFLRNASEYQPWLEISPEMAREQQAIKEVLRRRAGAKHFGSNSFIARSAKIFTTWFSIGDNSWVSAGVIIRGHVGIGSNSSVNPNTHIAGHVRIGSGVRIAGMVSIYGFNHGHARTDIPIYQQPLTQIGIEIGDDVWIGANALIADGCRIGAHSIVAGGAVVTKSCPEYSLVGGNPGHIIRDRRSAD